MQKGFYIDYFERGGEVPYFNLCEVVLGDIIRGYDFISSPSNFPELTLDLLTHIRKTTLEGEHFVYDLGLSNSTKHKLGDVACSTLLGIIVLHNDLIASVKRT